MGNCASSASSSGVYFSINSRGMLTRAGFFDRDGQWTPRLVISAMLCTEKRLVEKRGWCLTRKANRWRCKRNPLRSPRGFGDHQNRDALKSRPFVPSVFFLVIFEHPLKNQRRGGIRTLVIKSAHSGFRDRPVRPLRHLSVRAANYSIGLLNFHAVAQGRVEHIVEVIILQDLLEDGSGIRIAMHQKMLLRVVWVAWHISIRNAARRERRNRRWWQPLPAGIFFAENAHARFAVGNAATEGVGRLPGDDDDGVAFVCDVIFQVVQDAPASAMPRQR